MEAVDTVRLHSAIRAPAGLERVFSGPAYPRGYKNADVDKLEPFEVRDIRQPGGLQ